MGTEEKVVTLKPTGNKYEKYLPPDKVETYVESLNDPNLLNFQHEIALHEMRAKELTMRMDRETLSEDDIREQIREEFGSEIHDELIERFVEYAYSLLPTGYIDNQTYRRLDYLATRYERFLANREIRKADSSLRLLLRVIHDEMRAGEIWDDLQSVLESRRKLAVSEQEYMEKTSRLVPVDKAVVVLMATIDALREAVYQYVDDGTIRRHILTDAERRYSEIFGTKHAPGIDRITMDE